MESPALPARSLPLLPPVSHPVWKTGSACGQDQLDIILAHGDHFILQHLLIIRQDYFLSDGIALGSIISAILAPLRSSRSPRYPLSLAVIIPTFMYCTPLLSDSCIAFPCLLVYHTNTLMSRYTKGLSPPALPQGWINDLLLSVTKKRTGGSENNTSGRLRLRYSFLNLRPNTTLRLNHTGIPYLIVMYPR